ncbi:phosphatidylethanolamine N-methyltransferase [Verticillium alfalfae VaMs.102]|uniref:Phosphatidylethanolamine N-methyltransferase n=1 Tax=Verticillium alfalfae (strain VaMs.102 / ATCC MYA-4576 / FGSC 10136) TaxID=526221 RepID=C9S7C2_VERA1|nr:phosphatidylethanolamine N-methyltransferase [Verticillium alfalfae VaMs.102]EEY14707.1 phosphatidylethanolamine N-methyltransferase [Verticillium alfalfae VaMs.102]
MSSATDVSAGAASVRLRQKPALSPSSNQQSEPAAQQDSDQKPKKTFGRTPDGTVFTVPTTHDMVSQLLDPRQPKNLSDVLVLAFLGGMIAIAYLLPWGLKRPVFALIFLFWRASYNIGIGYLLTIQSQHRRLETWATRWKLFEHPSTGKQPRPWLYNTLKRELEAKIPEDYEFEKAPMEYNTWLTFRRVVDLILMCDFVSYCLFAIICGHKPEARASSLAPCELTFDGVFEMAPHPMYSIGYAGYYGISMMAASYEVLFISIVAHLAQFAFLVIVENPLIEKGVQHAPTSVYDSLGEFGWFFGDFFYDHQAKLTYTSIYRFLNNPERVFGTAGLWGAALITWSRAIFVMALFSQILTLGFIAYVEKPHMQKIYGRSLREEAGLTKFIKRSLPPPVQGWQRGVDKVLDDTSHFVEDFLEAARPKFTSGVKTIVRDTTALFNTYPARFTITRLSLDLAGFNPKHYSLVVEGTPSSLSAANERATGKESVTARFPHRVETLMFEYGAPLKVKWRAPANHGSKDWIGLYMVTDNHSREATEVPSLGRWVPTTPGQYDATADKAILVPDHPVSSDGSTTLVEGEVVFEGDRLWWTSGVFEFRYHHNGKHNVMTISQPFEVRIGRFDEEDVEVDSLGVYEKAVEQALLPLVRNCLDRDPDIAPTTVDEPFGGHVERDSKYAKRVVYAIHQAFGVEFAPAVVPADGNVKKLAWRICNAKQVLHVSIQGNDNAIREG